MKKMYVALAVLALTLASCKGDVKVETETTKTDTVTAAKPETETAPAAPMDTVAMRKAWEAFATPGEPHKMLAGEVGTWSVDMTFWMAPGAPPEKATSTCDVKMVLGGRYQESVYKGAMMGQPFEGKSTVAYNNKTEEYTTTWIDNMGTGIMVLSGKYNEATKTVSYKGSMVDPADGKTISVRQEYSMPDANTRKLENYDTKDGKESKTMEIVMKRK